MVTLATTEAGTQEQKGPGRGGRRVTSLCKLAGGLTGQGQKSSYCPENGLGSWPESSSCDWRMWTDYFLEKPVIS